MARIVDQGGSILRMRSALACAGIALVLLGIASPAVADDRGSPDGPAVYSGCTTPPCGALSNRTGHFVRVKWTDDDGATWQYSSVAPGTTKGGWFNDGIDVDFWQVKSGCRATLDHWATS